MANCCVTPQRLLKSGRLAPQCGRAYQGNAGDWGRKRNIWGGWMLRRAVIAGISPPAYQIPQNDCQQSRCTNPLFRCPKAAPTSLMRGFIAPPARGS